MGAENNENENKTEAVTDIKQDSENEEETTFETFQQAPAGKKRRISGASSNGTKKRQKRAQQVSVTVASSIFQNIETRLHTCMTDVVQWEEMADDYTNSQEMELVQKVKNNLEQIIKEKDSISLFFQQQMQKDPPLNKAEV